MLVLNKTDLVTPQQEAQLRALLARLNPAAKVRGPAGSRAGGLTRCNDGAVNPVGYPAG